MNREFQTLSPQTRQELCEVMDIMETELTVEEIREQLEMTQKGAVKNNRHNCKLILEHDPLLKDVFRHNILTEQTDIVKPVWVGTDKPGIHRYGFELYYALFGRDLRFDDG